MTYLVHACRRPWSGRTWVMGPLVAAAASGLLLAGCGADAGPFNAQGLKKLSCMKHQPNMPSSAYTGGKQADTVKVLEMMSYYVDNGHKPYCDGEDPAETDLAWARLYVELGGTSKHVKPILEARNARREG